MARAASGYHWSQQMPTPMVPALRRPGLEAGVAGPEVVLLLIAGAVGNVALAVDAEDGAVGVGDRHAVVIARAVLLEERDGDDDAELGLASFCMASTHGCSAAGYAVSNHFGSCLVQK